MLYNTTICYIVDHGHSEKIITSSHLILVLREKKNKYLIMLSTMF